MNIGISKYHLFLKPVFLIELATTLILIYKNALKSLSLNIPNSRRDLSLKYS